MIKKLYEMIEDLKHLEQLAKENDDGAYTLAFESLRVRLEDMTIEMFYEDSLKNDN